MSKVSKKTSILESSISLGGVSRTQKALFAKHLAVMLQSGLTISEALDIVEDSAKGKFKKILQGVSRAVKSGRPFSKALARYSKVFSGLFINATYAGESAGTLTENLENVAEQLRKENTLISKVKGAMLYPIVILVATFILGMVLSFVVLPKITPLFEGLRMDLPITTKALIWFSHFVQDYGVYLFFGIIAVVFFMAWLLRQKFTQPVTHWVVLNLPILKRITRNTNLARFSRILGTLLKSGVNIDEALEITKSSINNYYYKQALDKVSKSVGRGTKLSANLNQFDNLFPKLATRMIQVGEESGKFEETLFYLASFYEAEVDNATKSLSTAIEPILLAIIGLVVGFLALSIITPIYNITGNIRR
jgi:type II secretory pathway component PulF